VQRPWSGPEYRRLPLLLDPAAIGLPVAAWVRIRPAPGQLPKVAALAESIRDVSAIGSPARLSCSVICAAVDAIEDVLDRF